VQHKPCAFLGVTVEAKIQLYGYELILGSSIDPHFGPILLFGEGGQFIEVIQDYVLGLPPLNVRRRERHPVFPGLKELG
jgi:acetyltransferase